MRSGSRSDEMLVDSFRAGAAVPWDSPIPSIAGEFLSVVEKHDRVVALAFHSLAHVALEFEAEPLPTLSQWPIDARHPHNAVVGCGLWIHPEASGEAARQIHRLTRTLLAQELARKWCVVAVALPIGGPFDPAAIVQQIAARDPRSPIPEARSEAVALTSVLADGYWPIGITPDGRHVLCAWRNEVL